MALFLILEQFSRSLFVRFWNVLDMHNINSSAWSFAVSLIRVG